MKHRTLRYPDDEGNFHLHAHRDRQRRDKDGRACQHYHQLERDDEGQPIWLLIAGSTMSITPCIPVGP